MSDEVALFERARTTPGSPALVDDRVTYSWETLAEIILRTASALSDVPDAHKRPVAVCAHNSAESVVVIAAATLARVPMVPLSYHLKPEEIAYIAKDADCRLVFTDASTTEAVMQARSQGGDFSVIVWRTDHPEAERFDRWIEGRAPFSPDWDAPPAANLMYTSGTTGRPKGVLPPAGMNKTPLRDSLSVGLPERGPHLVAGPLYHGGPMRGSRHIWVGAPVIVLDRFDPEVALQRIQEFGIASSTMVPTHFKRFLSLPEDVKARYDVSSLRRVIHTGAPCPPDVKRAILEWWGPVLYDYYGGTETGTMCIIGPEEWLQHPGSVGRTLDGVEVMVRDEAGETLAANQIGTLYFRYTSGFVPRYRGAAGGTAEPLPDNSFTLGEIGYVNEEGFVFITDRGADLVLSGGVNIYPAEAERVLLANPRVADAVCIGVPDPEMGERLVALVERSADHPEVTEQEIIASCRAELASVKCPKTVIFVRTTGRNAMGKVNRSKLRDQFVAGGAAAIEAEAQSRDPDMQRSLA